MDEQLGARIKELRKALNLNQTQFGERIGVKQTTVAGYEKGARAPIDAVIQSICSKFGVSEMWLRTGEGDMFRKVSREEEVAHFLGELFSDDIGREFKTRFIWALSRLPVESWQALEQVIDLYNQATNPEK